MPLTTAATAMDRQTAHLTLIDLIGPGACQRLTDLLPRQGDLPPPLLSLTALAPGLRHLPDGPTRLVDAARGFTCEPLLDAEAQPMPWAEPPAAQMQRVVDALLGGSGALDRPWREGDVRARAQAAAADAGFTPAEAAQIGCAAAIACHWLAEAAQVGPDAAEPFGRWRAAAGLPPPRARHACQLPVALVSGGQGVAGWLKLTRVHQPGACGALVPAPVSALLLRAGTAWDATLCRVQQLAVWALADDHQTALADTAIAWDLSLQSDGWLDSVHGDSMGASLALGTLWLVQAHLRPTWQHPLSRLTAADLQSTACTAALGPGGLLDPVGGVLAKARGLLPLAELLGRLPGRPRLALHVSRRQDLPSLDLPDRVPTLPHDDMAGLAQALAESADPLSDAQRTLLHLLLDGPPDAPLPEPSNAAAHTARRQLLDGVFTASATRLRTWLLRNWAEWERERGGQVQQTYVPLLVRLGPPGPGQPRLAEHDHHADNLPRLLHTYDHDGRVDAFTLRGAPGAGKTTLLRHHLQRAARALLQQLHGITPQVPPDQPLRPLELPVYLRLADLPLPTPGDGNTPEALAALWAELCTLLRTQGAPDELLQLLNGHGPWAEQGLRPRLLLDGLNELRVAHPDYRPDRAAAVLNAAHAGLHGTLPGTQAPRPPATAPRRPLPLLVASRSDPQIGACAVRLQPVNVQEWQDDAIAAYLRRRLGSLELARHRLAQLQRVPHAMVLCRTPLHLALQCDLWRDGFQVRVDDRATLYAAWLWQRLRRALHPAEGQPASFWQNPQPTDEADPAHPDHPDHADQVLLTRADREAIDAARDVTDPARLRRLPRRGVLLRALVAQASAQWWADTDGGKPGNDRTASTVPWNHPDQPGRSVAAQLPARLRRRFADACAALGLVDVNTEAGNHWRFAHQSWGEYLASTTLLRGRPGDFPADEARLLARLVPPLLPGADDAEHLQSLATQGSGAWAEVPPSVWAALAPEPVPGHPLPVAISVKAFVDSFLAADQPTRDDEDAYRLLPQVRALQSVAANLGDGTWQLNEMTGLVSADLRQWGDTTGVSSAIGRPDDRTAWRQAQAAGAGWQFLLLHRVGNLRGFANHLWQVLLPELLAKVGRPGLLAALQGQQGRLALPLQADGAEVLGLALAGLDHAAPAAVAAADDDSLHPTPLEAWLGWLLAQPDAWPALQRVLPVLRARLEPEPNAGDSPGATDADSGVEDGAEAPTAFRPSEPQAAWRQPHPVLQWLRRVLLLTSVDAGTACLPGLVAGGTLTLLDAPWPASLQARLPAELRQRCAEGLRPPAFVGAGQRLARRLQAGLMLGTLGDTLRYEWPAGAPGLRPVRAMWSAVGPPAGPVRFAFGSPAGQGDDAERPAFVLGLGGFLACQLPLTVAEWQCFQRSPAGSEFEWVKQDDPDFNNPLQPVTGISWHAARAYAAWAEAWQAGLPGWPQADRAEGWPPLRLALPTELQWEAAARGPDLPGPVVAAASQGPAGFGAAGASAALAFNHANTRWLRPSPVGVFSASATPLGLQDTVGNMWEWCSNTLTEAQRGRGWRDATDRSAAGIPAGADAERHRALRGGAFSLTSDSCRAAFRYHSHPGGHDNDIGVRLVRVWLPHSEPRTPWAGDV